MQFSFLKHKKLKSCIILCSIKYSIYNLFLLEMETCELVDCNAIQYSETSCLNGCIKYWTLKHLKKSERQVVDLKRRFPKYYTDLLAKVVVSHHSLTGIRLTE
jgi:hypothetical protein